MSGRGRPEPRTVVLLPGTLVPTTAYDVVAARLVARGGFEVEMQWKKGSLEQATFTSLLGGNLRIRSYVPLKGKGLTAASGDNANPLFQKAAVKAPLISKEIIAQERNALQKVYEYDLQTKAGKRYHIRRSEK